APGGQEIGPPVPAVDKSCSSEERTETRRRPIESSGIHRLAGYMTVAPSTLPERRVLLLAGALGCAAFLPLVMYHRQFAQLFWFGDDLWAINEIDLHGYGRWVWQMFSENFVPLFKFLWGGLVLAGHGNHWLALLVLWLTHAANVALLSYWMLRSGFGGLATAVTALCFGLSASNLETLTWTTQWSAVLALMFFLLAAVDHPGLSDAVRPYGGWRIARQFLWSTCSAWSFSRGVLTGPIMAAAALVRPAGAPWPRRLLLAAAAVVPSVVTAIMIMKYSPVKHDAVLTTWPLMKEGLAFS